MKDGVLKPYCAIYTGLWASYITSLDLNFFICKKRITVGASSAWGQLSGLKEIMKVKHWYILSTQWRLFSPARTIQSGNGNTKWHFLDCLRGSEWMSLILKLYLILSWLQESVLIFSISFLSNSFWNLPTVKCCVSLELGSRLTAIMRSSQNSSSLRR